MPARQESKRSYSLFMELPRAVFSFGPAQSRINEQSNKSLLKLVWNEREIMIGILIMPTENLCAEFSTGHVRSLMFVFSISR